MDIGGRYVVNRVRSGICTLVAPELGFATQRNEGVRVSIDLTTAVDFVLEGQETGAD